MKKISERKRIVVKVGTSTLTHKTGRLNIRRVEQLVKTLADLYNAGHEVISGFQRCDRCLEWESSV